MPKVIIIISYHTSLLKRLFDFVISGLGLFPLFPIILFISIVIKLTSKGPALFIQKRTGFKGKPFKIIMFRTMHVGAERDQAKYAHLNEVDGPVFKIYNDPRYTEFGKYLAP